MSGLKKVAVLAVSMLAVGAIAASSAQAGTANVSVDGGAPCAVTFDNSGAPPTSPITISNIVADPSCDVDIVDGGGTLTISGATATLSGGFEADIGFFGSCIYAGNLTGGSAATSLSGTATRQSGSSFLCPSSVSASLTSITY